VEECLLVCNPSTCICLDCKEQTHYYWKQKLDYWDL
jgi:hypothetical protein